METFGERYRRAWQAWREAHPEAGADEVAFVSACGIRPSTASPFKNMITPPPHERVLQIARTAGVDPGWLAYGDDSRAPAPVSGARPPAQPKPHSANPPASALRPGAQAPGRRRA